MPVSSFAFAVLVSWAWPPNIHTWAFAAVSLIDSFTSKCLKFAQYKDKYGSGEPALPTFRNVHAVTSASLTVYTVYLIGCHVASWFVK
jgi:hypothetical protein